MRNIIIALFAASVAVSAAPAYAQSTGGPGDSGTLTAQVDTVTVTQEVGEYSSLSVVDEYGVTVIFDVMPATTILGPVDEPISLDNIKQGDTVTIEYSDLAGGLGIARSIKLTE